MPNRSASNDPASNDPASGGAASQDTAPSRPGGVLTAPVRGRQRSNRGSEQVRDRLIEGAIIEFAAHGFEGASTRMIAEHADAHPSQINYHFDSKEELWRLTLERLLAELDATIGTRLEGVAADDLRGIFEATIRGLVELVARRPELNRIMIQEATSPSDRLQWLVSTHLGERHRALISSWIELQARGGAGPIPADLLWHVLLGSASLLWANAPEALLMGIDTHDPKLVEAHADTLVAMFLPAASTSSTNHQGQSL